MKKCLFKGIGTALVTPFKNGKVDYVSLEIMLQKQVEANVDAVVVLGTTGEPCTLKDSERKGIIKCAMGFCKNKTKVIVGCGSNDTQKAIKFYGKRYL